MKQRRRFLMCRPEYYDVCYVINPWMEGNVHKAWLERATAQWHKLHQTVSARAETVFVDPQPGLPDMPFVANAGLVVGGTVFLSHFKHDERRGEERFYEEWFEANGFSVVKAPAGIAFEGAGDALFDRTEPRLWAAFGHRSDSRSHDFLRDQLAPEVVSLRLVDKRFYHLDTCFCPLEGGYILYYPKAFDAASQQLIEETVPADHRIAIDEDDAMHFACNAVNIGDTVILNRASEALARRLATSGFDVVEVELTEFMKAGGAAKCLTLRLDDADALAAPRRQIA